MKNKYSFCVLILLFLACKSEQHRISPREIYQQLFEDIQSQRVYADNKTFVDVIPKASPAIIISEYQKHKDESNFNLKAFANQYFELPATNHVNFVTQTKDIRAHIDTLWTVLERDADTVKNSSLIPLPNPYIVPGGRFREIYYWDSYFTMLGLKESGRIKTIQNMVDNFAFLINDIGFIPNGNRTYYLTRSQPPFFSLMVDLLAQVKGDQIYSTYQAALIKEYDFWMAGAEDLKNGQAHQNTVKLDDSSNLNRYWDTSDLPREESYFEDVEAAKTSSQTKGEFYRNIRAAAESGWDFSSRWFKDGKNLTTIQTTNIIPVDLNCLLYFMEQTISKSYKIQQKTAQEDYYQKKAAKRKMAIQKFCWDQQSGWFRDYNFVTKKQTDSWNLAGVFPLYFNLATTEQAGEIAQNIELKFLKPGGLITSLTNTHQQWDAPNGWAPLQYISIKGLENYDKNLLASAIAKRWISLNKKVFKETGKLMEKYNVTDLKLDAGGGEYPLQDGFGWTNGVLLKLMNDYGND